MRWFFFTNNIPKTIHETLNSRHIEVLGIDKGAFNERKVSPINKSISIEKEKFFHGVKVRKNSDACGVKVKLFVFLERVFS